MKTRLEYVLKSVITYMYLFSDQVRFSSDAMLTLPIIELGTFCVTICWTEIITARPRPLISNLLNIYNQYRSLESVGTFPKLTIGDRWIDDQMVYVVYRLKLFLLSECKDND